VFGEDLYGKWTTSGVWWWGGVGGSGWGCEGG
jgi:hypothetical protein